MPPRESANAIQAALESGDNRNVTLKVYSDADPTFTIVEEPDYADVLVDWILAQR